MARFSSVQKRLWWRSMRRLVSLEPKKNRLRVGAAGVRILSEAEKFRETR